MRHLQIFRLSHPDAIRRVSGPALVSLGILLVGSFWTPTDTIVVCPLRLLFGIPCPTCGLTRSVSATLHGNLAAVPELNLLGPFVVLASIVVIVAAALQLAGQPVLDRLRSLAGPAFFTALGFEIVFVWPLHLGQCFSGGWRPVMSNGLATRFICFLWETHHVVF